MNVVHLFCFAYVTLAAGNTLRKCCDLDKTVMDFNCTRISHSGEFGVALSKSFGLNLGQFQLEFGLDCKDKNKFHLNRSIDEEYFDLSSNGELTKYYEDKIFKKFDFCVDLFDGGFGAFECEDTINLETYTIGMIISMPFLILTFIVYLLLPERNLHAKCLMCYVLSLALAYFFLVFIQFNNSLSPATCAAFAAFCHYFFMSSFCWMNISCVDIFWTFSGKRGFGLSNKSAERKRFLIYCLYTYLFPLCLIGIIFILNQGEKKTWFHPQFGHGQCFLGKGYPHLLYFYGPMGIMLIFNVILFTLTALKIRQINRDTAMLKRPENKMHYDRDRQTFQLYMKLLLALGINWTMEFISWLVNWTLNDTYKEIWYVTDFCNAIYGVIIFIIFVCKKSIWIMLKKRYYIFKGQPQKARSLSMRTSAFEMSQTEKTVVY
ncbi:PREDICTED: G-protein coupled receptor Mth2-like isoform X3 [Nicrophorus vespilloides]|uniref:G-protein coupled receptor Mth2-like isoform X3 n=1 Tax=Nicrophorus vespilloides TaxID=110193 RepID=A0ABM1M7Y4_NICVS|nr:PREDICTED: G-protein coupled receptor Mth2-like isoform X3 [Nicrophorus vespilloides]